MVAISCLSWKNTVENKHFGNRISIITHQQHLRRSDDDVVIFFNLCESCQLDWLNCKDSKVE